MKDLKDFLEFCKEESTDKKFMSQLYFMANGYYEEEQLKHYKQMQGLNQPCLQQEPLNEEYVYNEIDERTPEYPLCKYCELREYNKITDRYDCGAGFEQEVHCTSFVHDDEHDKSAALKYWEDMFSEILNTKVRFVEVDGEIIKEDNIHRPSYYGDFTPLDAMSSGLISPEELIGFLKGNIIKYITRYQCKNGLEDLNKAEEYLRLLKKVENGEDIVGE